MKSTNVVSESTNILVKQCLIASLGQIATNLLKIFNKFIYDLFGATSAIDQEIFLLFFS